MIMYDRFDKIFSQFDYEVREPDGWCPLSTVCTVEGDAKELRKLVKILFDVHEYKLYLDDVEYAWGFSDLEAYGRHKNRLQIVKR